MRFYWQTTTWFSEENKKLESFWLQSNKLFFENCGYLLNDLFKDISKTFLSSDAHFIANDPLFAAKCFQGTTNHCVKESQRIIFYSVLWFWARFSPAEVYNDFEFQILFLNLPHKHFLNDIRIGTYLAWLRKLLLRWTWLKKLPKISLIQYNLSWAAMFCIPKNKHFRRRLALMLFPRLIKVLDVFTTAKQFEVPKLFSSSYKFSTFHF